MIVIIGVVTIIVQIKVIENPWKHLKYRQIWLDFNN